MLIKTTEDWVKQELAAALNTILHEATLTAVNPTAAKFLFSFTLYATFKDISNSNYRIFLPNLVARIFEAGGGDTMTALYVMAAICQRKADCLLMWASNTKAFEYILYHNLLNIWQTFDAEDLND